MHTLIAVAMDRLSQLVGVKGFLLSEFIGMTLCNVAFQARLNAIFILERTGLDDPLAVRTANGIAPFMRRTAIAPNNRVTHFAECSA